MTQSVKADRIPPALKVALDAGLLPPERPMTLDAIDLQTAELLVHLKAWARREIEMRFQGVGLADRERFNR